MLHEVGALGDGAEALRIRAEAEVTAGLNAEREQRVAEKLADLTAS
jgi:hypothetical protein